MKESCVHVLSVRNGRLIGSKSFFPNVPEGAANTEILSAFLTQYYLNPIQ